MTATATERQFASESLGVKALREKRFQDAYDLLRYCQEPISRINKSAALCGLGRLQDAIEVAEAVRDHRPELLAARLQLIALYHETSRFTEEEREIEAAIEIKPGNRQALFARAMLRLQRGEYTLDAWRDYEARPTHAELCEHLDEFEEWRGQSLEGKTLMVVREQGIGDQIMFSRYLRLIDSARAKDLVVYTEPDLARLMDRLYGDIPNLRIITSDREAQQFDVDYWIGFGSLPLALGEPVPPIVEARDVTAAKGGIGVCWRGSPKHPQDRHRSVPEQYRHSLDKFNPVLLHQQELQERGIFDFADLADLIETLEYVVTVDTSVAHLAGTLGVPTLILNYMPGDWRWGHGFDYQNRVRWYDSSDVLSQSRQDDWDGPIGTAQLILDGWQAGLISKPSNPLSFVRANQFEGFSYDPLDRWLGRSLELYGEWSDGEVDLFWEVIRETDTVVEVGANVGCHTVPLAVLAHSVTALEPNRETFRHLTANAGHMHNVRLLNCAAGSSQGECGLKNITGNPGGTEVCAGTGTAVTTIDALIGDGPLHFLKADCEGSELAVLKGAENTIARCRPLLYVEADRPWAQDPLIDWIARHRYRVYYHEIPLFNPDNAKRNRINVFGGLVSKMLCCVPAERYDLRPVIEKFGMERIRPQAEKE